MANKAENRIIVIDTVVEVVDGSVTSPRRTILADESGRFQLDEGIHVTVSDQGAFFHCQDRPEHEPEGRPGRTLTVPLMEGEMHYRVRRIPGETEDLK